MDLWKALAKFLLSPETIQSRRLKCDDLSLSLFSLYKFNHRTAITIPAWRIHQVAMAHTFHFKKTVPNFSKNQLPKLRFLSVFIVV